MDIPYISKGSVYGGKIPLVGVIYETGGKLFANMPDTSIVRSIVEKAREIPIASKVVNYFESRPEVLTGIRFGPESVRELGRSIKSRVSGSINFLNQDVEPWLQLQKISALESIISRLNPLTSLPV